MSRVITSVPGGAEAICGHWSERIRTVMRMRMGKSKIHNVRVSRICEVRSTLGKVKTGEAHVGMICEAHMGMRCKMH